MDDIKEYLDNFFKWEDNWYVDDYEISVFIDCEKPFIIESNQNESFLFCNLKELKTIHKKIIQKQINR